jgi:hypothetical protein
MNISKADAVAHLSKWHNAGTQVRAVLTSVVGKTTVVGQIIELDQASLKVAGSGCEMLLYFRGTSEFDYRDVRESVREAFKMRENKYPTVIVVKFANGHQLDIMEFFSD